MRVRTVADARRSRTPARGSRARRRDISRPHRAPRDADRRGAAHGLRDGRLPRLRDRHGGRQRASLSRGTSLRSRRCCLRPGRARDRWSSRLMPWRRFRKKVERPIDVSKSIEESLEDAADGEAEEDVVELAELDDASTAEAATGQPDDDRAPTELGDKLRGALDPDAPHRVDEARRERRPRSAPRGIALDGSSGAARSDDAHVAPKSYPELGVDLHVEVARGLRLKNPVMT